MNEPENIPAFPCARCNRIASHYQGHQHLCSKHYRFGQMRATAKRHNKYVPTWEELEQMYLITRLDCNDCNRIMNWTSKDGKCSVISLQHYRDGQIGFVCRSCNTRHASMDNDDYRNMPKNKKRCPQCKDIKMSTQFSKDNGRSGELKRKSWCKSCCNKSHKRWSTTMLKERSKHG